jgi:hypothetical protein
VAVPRAEQREALRFLTEYAFSERAFDVPEEVVRQFGANRWSHWGERTTFGGRIDYPLHQQVLGIQTALLGQITHPLVFARIRDGETKFGTDAVLPIPELMDQLTRAVWNEVYEGAGRNVPSMRRDLQRAYLDRMTRIMLDNEPGMPADARSVTRMRLRDLRGRIDRALRGARGMDAYTTAHLTEARARIDQVLSAGLEARR